MPENFIDRLTSYYQELGNSLAGKAKKASSIFPNTSDKGTAREEAYLRFLQQHAPKKCNIFLGGFLFGSEGDESRQLDIIITTDTCPKFEFAADTKSFAPVEGTLAVASIKSTLDKKELFDALNGLASIPPTQQLLTDPNGAVLQGYADWPLKIIYAHDGVSWETLRGHLQSFYDANNFPVARWPNIIHVAGKYFVHRVNPTMSTGTPGRDLTQVKEQALVAFTVEPDVQAIMWTLHHLQTRTQLSAKIRYQYGEILNRIINNLSDQLE